jgi:hypothetical protein
MASIHFGIPVEVREAYRIFGIPFDPNEFEWGIATSKGNTPLTTYLAQFGLIVGYTDKEQYVIGFKLKEFCEVGENMMTSSRVIAKLAHLSSKWYAAMNAAKADMTCVNIYPIESEIVPTVMPEPCLLIWEY